MIIKAGDYRIVFENVRSFYPSYSKREGGNRWSGFQTVTDYEIIFWFGSRSEGVTVMYFESEDLRNGALEQIEHAHGIGQGILDLGDSVTYTRS